MDNLTQLRKSIKEEFEEDLSIPATRIQLFTQDHILIEDLDDIPDQYFRKKRDGGLYLNIIVKEREHSRGLLYLRVRFYV
jgi:hypothetical protein